MPVGPHAGGRAETRAEQRDSEPPARRGGLSRGAAAAPGLDSDLQSLVTVCHGMSLSHAAAPTVTVTQVAARQPAAPAPAPAGPPPARWPGVRVRAPGRPRRLTEAERDLRDTGSHRDGSARAAVVPAEGPGR